MKALSNTNLLPVVAANALLVKYGKGKKQYAVVNSLDEASQIVQAYIASKDLGGSEWYGKDTGFVYDHTGAVVAKVSYNGRLWDSAGNALT